MFPNGVYRCVNISVTDTGPILLFAKWFVIVWLSLRVVDCDKRTSLFCFSLLLMRTDSNREVNFFVNQIEEIIIVRTNEGNYFWLKLEIGIY